MYKADPNIPRIVKATGISDHVVREVLGKHMIETSQRTIKTRDGQDQIVKMYQAKNTGGQIAKALGIPLATVYRELRRAGVAEGIGLGRKTALLSTIATDGSLNRFKSNWEAVFAKYLDSQEVEWAYEAHSWLLSDGRAYTPDFWVPAWGLHVEIKGYMTEGGAEKIKLFRSEFPNVSLCVVDRNAFSVYGIKLPTYFESMEGFSRLEIDEAEMTDSCASE